MEASFEQDSHPGKPKILFIGLAQSSHTQAWIDLLENAEFNVRLFALPVGDGLPPSDWPVKTYLTSLYSQSNSFLRKNHYARIVGNFHKFYNKYSSKYNLIEIDTDEKWLSAIIKTWKPDIIHTLGLEPASYYYLDVRKKYKLESIGKWVVQIRGGPDLMLNRLRPDYFKKIKHVFQECHQVIADNQQNYENALEMGLERDHICKLGTLPGTGGIDVEALKSRWQKPPSDREKIIVWPKAYECLQSKSLPVFEALKIVWSKISPCKIIMFAADDETMLWFQTLPQYIRESSSISYRVPRDEVLNCLINARVMLAPSILDGVPNSLYEAMAAGAFPIVSPLETITPIVRQEQNVLFAGNLYPNEIADALVTAMNDDALIDKAAENNLNLVRKIANRKTIKTNVVNYYQGLVEEL
jgi:glycosyltransferase involved in cell wall biosynthesis